MQVVDTLSIIVELASHQSGNLIKVLNKRPTVIGASAWGMSSQAVRYLPPFDAIIPRIGSTITDYGLAVVRQFENRGVFVTASSLGISKSRDKLASLQLMSHLGLPVPKTAVIEREESIGVAMQIVGGPPAIIKLNTGTQGRGVILVKNLATAVAVYKKLRNTHKQILLQEFLPEADGKDTRVIVVGNECIAAMQRIAPQGDFRSNLHLGGTAVKIKPSPEAIKIALDATKAHGLEVAGVDIIHSNRGNLILEVNSSPGLEGIEKASGHNVAKSIIQFIEQKLSKMNSHSLHQNQS